MLSRPKKAAGEQVAAVRVLAIDPPGEVDQQLVKRAPQEEPVALAARAGHLVDAPAGPGVDRRIHVAERKLVGGNLAVGVHVPFAQEQQQLLLGELAVDARHRQHVKRQIPRRVPRVLPFVGHRDDVAIEQVRPVVIAAVFAARRAAAADRDRPRASSSRRGDRTACW